MEGSGRGRANSGAGRSSISDLFGRDPSAPQTAGTQGGGLFGPQGSFGDFQRGAFPAQASHTQEVGYVLQLSGISNLEGRLPVVVVSDHSQSIQVRGALLSKGTEPAGRESTNREATGTRKTSSQECRTGNNSQKGHGESRSLQGSSQNLNHAHGDTQPCFLSSSLYYGGRDVCVDTSTTKSEGLLGAKKNNQEDDTNASNLTSASRGNWWQGSLYY